MTAARQQTASEQPQPLNALLGIAIARLGSKEHAEQFAKAHAVTLALVRRCLTKGEERSLTLENQRVVANLEETLARWPFDAHKVVVELARRALRADDPERYFNKAWAAERRARNWVVSLVQERKR